MPCACPAFLASARGYIWGSFLAPGDARRFVGWRVAETLERAALAAIDSVKGWAELDFGVLPNFVAGGAQSLEHLLAGSGVLPQRRSGRSRNSKSSNHPCPEHFFSSLTRSPVDVVNAAVSKPSVFEIVELQRQ